MSSACKIPSADNEAGSVSPLEGSGLTPLFAEYRAACAAWNKCTSDDRDPHIQAGERLYAAAAVLIDHLTTPAEVAP